MLSLMLILKIILFFISTQVVNYKRKSNANNSISTNVLLPFNFMVITVLDDINYVNVADYKKSLTI